MSNPNAPFPDTTTKETVQTTSAECSGSENQAVILKGVYALNLEEHAKYRLFFLKNKDSDLNNAFTYLKKRNWEIESTTGVKETLVKVLNKPPIFLFISSEHFNKKVRVFPKILAASLPIVCVGFADSQSLATISHLTSWGLEHILVPPVSGPMIERMVSRILREIKQKKTEILYRINKGITSAEDKEFIIIQKGSGMGQEQSSNTQVMSKLLQSLNSDNSDSDLDSSGLSISEHSNAPDWMVDHSRLPPQSKNRESSHETESSFDFLSKVGTELHNNNNSNSKSRKELNPHDWADLSKEVRRRAESYRKARGHTSTRNDGAPPNEDILAAVNSLGHEEIPKSLQSANNREFDELKDELYEDLKKNASDNNKPSDDPIDDSPEAEQIKISRNLNLGSEKKITILEKGSMESLELSIRKSKLKTVELKDEKISNVSCIVIESSKFSGYLITAMAKTIVIDENFLNLVKIRLFAFLRANGEEFNENDSLNLKLQEVDFEEWALNEAEFLKKSVHDGNEVAMAFFPTLIKNTLLEQSAHISMMKISLTDLKEDTIVEFDLYIHLERNNKYLLYTPEKSILFGEQIKRLQEKGVTHLHLRVESSESLKKYNAQNYLNDKIKSFNSKK